MVRWPRLVAGVVGLAWYVYVAGARTINPLNSSWLTNDWMQHWTGFLFFKQEPWTFPLGKLTSIPYPFGTSIGFTDSNPLIAIALKPFADWLPSEFQFIGLWLFLCFGLQGYFGALLCSAVTPNRWHQALGGSIFALSPVLTSRVGHDTLCAQWLVLGLLYLGLRRCGDAATARRLAFWSVAGVCLAASIHPYLTAICFALALAGLGRFVMEKHLSIRSAGLRVLAVAAGTVFILWVIGYFGVPGATAGGFGEYSADLLALFDPQGSSRLIAPISTKLTQWEGFAFPGIGGWLIIAAAIVWVARRPAIDWQHRQVIVWTAVVLAVYALSSHITFAGEIVAHTRKLYRLFEPLPSLFRASGRFIWPLHYLALLFGVWGVSRLGSEVLRRSAATAILAAAIAIQVLDFNMDPWWFSDKRLRQAPVADFALARGHYDHLALFLPQMGDRCDGASVDQEHVFRYTLLAYRLGVTYNSGTFARVAWQDREQQCRELARDVEAGNLDVRTIYVVDAKQVKTFQAVSAVCNRFDGDWVCVSPRNTDPFRVFVETGRAPAPK